MALAEKEFSDLALAEMETVALVARRLSRDPGWADDLVQETYLRAISFRNTFELREFGIRPWLARILHGIHFTHLRREARQPTSTENSWLETADRSVASANENDPCGFEQMDQRLVKAVDSLKGPYRDALLLWVFYDLNYAQIAEKLGVPIGTVMSRLHRARKLLRARLSGSMTARGTLQ